MNGKFAVLRENRRREILDADTRTARNDDDVRVRKQASANRVGNALSLAAESVS